MNSLYVCTYLRVSICPSAVSFLVSTSFPRRSNIHQVYCTNYIITCTAQITSSRVLRRLHHHVYCTDYIITCTAHINSSRIQLNKINYVYCKINTTCTQEWHLDICTTQKQHKGGDSRWKYAHIWHVTYVLGYLLKQTALKAI